MAHLAASPHRARHLLSPTTLSRPNSHPSTPLFFIFLVLLLVRLTAALFSLISDCDETFNYWEALHLLVFGQYASDADVATTRSFKTWEYDPRFAIRSWAYILPHAAIGWMVKTLGASKVQVFYALRASLALVSALAETRLLNTVSTVINRRCAWFLFFMLACNAGLWSSSVALLPSSFTLYTTTLALSYALQPSTTSSKTSPTNRGLPIAEKNRLVKATISFATGAILGWPFAIVLAVPFVIEELFLPSGNLIRRNQLLSFVAGRCTSFFKVTLIAASLAIPVFLIDSFFYGKAVLVPLNIIVYNILSARRGAGPELYGVEPPWFYLANLALNAGPIVLLLALGSLPLLVLARLLDSNRFQGAETADEKGHKAASPSALIGSSRFTLLAFRLFPFYLWLGLLSSQPHKEERFMFPAYTVMCLNAAIGLELSIGLVERVVIWVLLRQAQGHTGGNKNTRIAGVSPLLYLPNFLSLVILLASSAFALLRITGTVSAYHAPFTVLNPLTTETTSEQVMGLFQRPKVQLFEQYLFGEAAGKLKGQGGEEEALNICYGKEWYRFPNSFFLPAGLSGAFIKSGFDGILPKHFPENGVGEDVVPPNKHRTSPLISTLDSLLFPISSSSSSIAPLIQSTRQEQEGFNDLNREEWDRYLNPESECHLLVDSDQLESSSSSSSSSQEALEPHPNQWEPRYSRDQSRWEKLTCELFLDSEASKNHNDANGKTTTRMGRLQRTIARILWTPKSWRRRGLRYREFCLLANRGLMVGLDDGLEDN